MSFTFSRIPSFDVAVSSRPRRNGGGDYHAVFAAPRVGSMAVAVGDVAGHDALAAHLVQVAGRLLHDRMGLSGTLGAVLEYVNRELTPHMRAGRFMTLFLAVLEAADRSLRWVSAGHAPVLAYDPVSDHFDDVPAHDIPLGIDPAWRYHEFRHMGWAGGALLVVGADGIIEVRRADGMRYGMRRLTAQVRSARHGAARSIVAAVEMDVAAFLNGEEAEDDATLLVVKAVGSPYPKR